MSDGDAVRDVLLASSDHRSVRAVFDAHTGVGSVDTVDRTEAMRATGGELALVAQDGAADVYVRWNPTSSRFEHLSLWPPWTLVGYDHADRTGVEALLTGVTSPVFVAISASVPRLSPAPSRDPDGPAAF